MQWAAPYWAPPPPPPPLDWSMFTLHPRALPHHRGDPFCTPMKQTSNFVSALVNCRGKSVFSLMWIGKLLPRRNCLKKVWSMDKTLVGTEESAGASIWRCSAKKVFWKIAQKSQKRYLCWSLFLMKFYSFQEHLFCRISVNSCFRISLVLGVYSLFWCPFRGGGRL